MATEQNVHLKVDDLLSRARSAADLTDFGDEWFLEPLNSLIAMINREAQLVSQDAVAVQVIVNYLADRLKLVDWLKKNPAVHDEALSVAGVIVGLPRGGSTLAHRLVAASPQLTAVRGYEIQAPVPLPDEKPGDPSPRIARAGEMINWALETWPGLISMHPMHPMSYDEEVGFLDRGFISVMYMIFTHLPSYNIWQWQQDQSLLYSEIVLWLKALQYQKPQRRKQKWLLKSPAHLLGGGLRTALDTFPDAKFIMTHRMLENVIPSYCSIQQEQLTPSTRNLDPTTIGPQVMDMFDRSLHHLIEVREEQPADRFVDIQYVDTVKRPMKVFEDMMAAMNLEITEADRRAAEDWMAANGRDTHPRHHYSAEEFGIDCDEMAHRFAFYSDRYLNQAA